MCPSHESATIRVPREVSRPFHARKDLETSHLMQNVSGIQRFEESAHRQTLDTRRVANIRNRDERHAKVFTSL